MLEKGSFCVRERTTARDKITEKGSLCYRKDHPDNVEKLTVREKVTVLEKGSLFWRMDHWVQERVNSFRERVISFREVYYCERKGSL